MKYFSKKVVFIGAFFIIIIIIMFSYWMQSMKALAISPEAELIDKSFTHIYNYITLPASTNYYGNMIISILGHKIEFITQFYVDVMINKEIILEFLNTLNWSILLEKYGDTPLLYEKIIDEYCAYIKSIEEQYNKQLYSQINIEEVKKNINEYLNQHLSGYKKQYILSLNLVNYIDIPNYIKSYDYLENNMSILGGIYKEKLVDRTRNPFFIAQYITHACLDKISNHVSLTIEANPKIILLFSKDLHYTMEILSYYNTNFSQLFESNPLAVGFSIIIEDHIITPGAKQVLMDERNKELMRHFFPYIFNVSFEDYKLQIHLLFFVKISINL